jgi:hypothetical protein
MAVGVLCECLCAGVPIVLAPNVKAVLAEHPAFPASLRELASWGVHMLEQAPQPRGVRMAPWEAIRRHHPEVPQVVIVVASGSDPRSRRLNLGHFAAGRWQLTDQPTDRAEVLVSGEGLQRGPVDVLGTLLHEAAHGLAYARKISDTSRQGRYHNRRYATLAGELGLDVAHRDPIGWSVTSVPESTTASYVEVLAELAEALVLWRRAEQPSPAGPAGPGTPWPAPVPVVGGSGWPIWCWSWPRSCVAPAPGRSNPTLPIDAYQRVAERACLDCCSQRVGAPSGPGSDLPAGRCGRGSRSAGRARRRWPVFRRRSRWVPVDCGCGARA